MATAEAKANKGAFDRTYIRKKQADAAEIGSLPPIADPARRARCEGDAVEWLKTYFPGTFTLPFSPDQIKVIRKAERLIHSGGMFAQAMPRGSGKTATTERLSILAAIFGHPYVVVIGADKDIAIQMLGSIKAELGHNGLLLADYPEICFPIASLEDEPRRCLGQTCDGEKTGIVWKQHQVSFPSTAGKAAYCLIGAYGLTGRLRGMKHTRPDGKTVRPSFVILDDPQTDESAGSPAQCQSRERIISGAILGLAGPGKKITGFANLTVIRKGDLADRLLDRKIYPEWQGDRMRMVYAFPAAEKEWDEYAEIYIADMMEELGTDRANAYYGERREIMDAGCVVAWPERHNEDELSGIQHAMNLRIRRKEAFFCEYQNDPPAEIEQANCLSEEAILRQVNGYKRGEIPAECDKLVAFIDVQKQLLWYMVAAIDAKFGAYVINYGAFPSQNSRYYTLASASHTLERAYAGLSLEARLFAGLRDLTEVLCAPVYKRDDGIELKMGLCLVDANWGESTDVVYSFCRQSRFTLMPSHGKYIGAASTPFAQYKRAPSERIGHHWLVSSRDGRSSIRHALIDTNYWKSFLQVRLGTGLGASGAWSIYQDSPASHRMLAEQLAAEYRVVTSGKGRQVDEWKARPGRDNHLLDCAVGCAVAASITGSVIAEATVPRRPRPPRARVSYAD